jgi:hypothetical protein
MGPVGGARPGKDFREAPPGDGVVRLREIAVWLLPCHRWRRAFGRNLPQVKRLKPSGDCPERAGEATPMQGGILPDGQDGQPAGSRLRKAVSPKRRRACAEHGVCEPGVSQRKACAVLGQHSSVTCPPPAGSLRLRRERMPRRRALNRPRNSRPRLLARSHPDGDRSAAGSSPVGAGRPDRLRSWSQPPQPNGGRP